MLKNVTETAKEYVSELQRAEENLIVSKHVKEFSGFRRNGINVIGARPFVGMTEFLLSIANELASQGQKTMFVSTCHSTQEVIKKIIALENGIKYTEVTNSLVAEYKPQTSNVDNIFIYEASVNKELRITSNLIPILIENNIENLIIDAVANNMQELLKIIDYKKVTIFLGQLLGKSVDKHYWPTYKDFLKKGIEMAHVHVAIGLVRLEFYSIIMDENGDTTKGHSEIVVIKSPHENANTRYRIQQDAHFKFPDWSPE